ncbi:MAG: metal ABC transporter ATP-binding protein [Salinivirgaceae bacterium]|jgi:zinc transport system ATP-binding protein|nr:metal ABC transporter ATP-binding protein [Salinivirgaceae bacterium]
MHKNLIDIKNLAVGYESQKVLDNVSLTISSDDFIGVIGPNGGGKTTLIKTILGLTNSWSGTVTSNISQSKIGYLPQFNPFDKKFPINVKDVVLSGLAGKKGLFKKYQKSDIEKVAELMEHAGVGHLKNKSIGNLSGGQMQRTLLCRALINEPELLILDEPSTFVDNQFENELFEWLRKLNENIAILMVSHDIGTISSHVKTIACVNYHLHYHKSSKITAEQLAHYNCPIQLISHGVVPHQVLAEHKH